MEHQFENEVLTNDLEYHVQLKMIKSNKGKSFVSFLPIFFSSDSSLCRFKLDFIVFSGFLPASGFSSMIIELIDRVLIFFRFFFPFHRQQKIIVIRLNTNANIFAIVEPIFATKSIINGTPNAL